MFTKLTAAAAATVAVAATGAALTAAPAGAAPQHCSWSVTKTTATVYCGTGPTGADTYRAKASCWLKDRTVTVPGPRRNIGEGRPSVARCADGYEVTDRWVQWGGIQHAG